jgi:hypothetical protein
MKFLNASRHKTPGAQHGERHGVLNWIMAKTDNLFQDLEEDTTPSMAEPSTTKYAVMHSGESIEWSLNQDNASLLQSNLKEGLQTITPSFIWRALAQLNKFIWISVVTDEVLEEEESTQAGTTLNMNATEMPEPKKSFFRQAVSAMNPRRTFTGFVNLWRRIKYFIPSLKNIFTAKRLYSSQRKVEVKAVNTYIPDTSFHIRGPGSEKILQVRVLYNRI